MLFQEIRNLAGIDLRIRPEVEGNAFVLALDFRHVQTVGRHTDQGDPQQIVHCLRDIAETVQQLILHFIPLFYRLDAGDPFVNIQLLCLVDNVFRRNVSIHIQIDHRSEIHCRMNALQVLHRFVQHLAVQVISHGLHMSVLT